MRKAAMATVIGSIFLAGCGGGGGGGSTVAPPKPQSAAGLWQGTYSENGTVIDDLRCLIADSGQLACLLFDQDGTPSAGADGDVTIDIATVNGSGAAFAVPGNILPDGTTVGSLTITDGTVKTQTSLTMSIDIGGSSGSVSASYDPAYARASDLATVAGTYTQFTFIDEPSSFSVDTNGVLFFQSQSGCTGNGQVSIMDSTVNIYSVSLTLANCNAMDGDYSGLGYMTDVNGTNDGFSFGAFNTVNIFNSAGAIVGTAIK